MLRGAARVTVDSFAEAEAAVQRTQRALASGAAICIGQGFDEGTMEATLAELRDQHREAVRHPLHGGRYEARDGGVRTALAPEDALALRNQ